MQSRRVTIRQLPFPVVSWKRLLWQTRFRNSRFRFAFRSLPGPAATRGRRPAAPPKEMPFPMPLEQRGGWIAPSPPAIAGSQKARGSQQRYAATGSTAMPCPFPLTPSALAELRGRRKSRCLQRRGYSLGKTMARLPYSETEFVTAATTVALRSRAVARRPPRRNRVPVPAIAGCTGDRGHPAGRSRPIPGRPLFGEAWEPMDRLTRGISEYPHVWCEGNAVGAFAGPERGPVGRRRAALARSTPCKIGTDLPRRSRCDPSSSPQYGHE